MGANLTRHAYADILRVWALAWQGLEDALEEGGRVCGWDVPVPAPRGPLAWQDLRALEAHDPAAVRAPRQTPPELTRRLPAITHTAELWGLAYVAVGSSLGGQVIVRHLRAVLGPVPPVPCAFFGAEAIDGLAWPAWLKRLNAQVTEEEAQQAAVRAALQAFDHLEQAFRVYRAEEADEACAHPALPVGVERAAA